MITRNFSNNKRWELSFLFIAPISRPSIAIIVLWLAFCCCCYYCSYFIRFYEHPAKWNDAKYVERFNLSININWVLNQAILIDIYRVKEPLPGKLLHLVYCCEIYSFAHGVFDSNSDHRLYSIFELWLQLLLLSIALLVQNWQRLTERREERRKNSIDVKRQARCTINKITALKVSTWLGSIIVDHEMDIKSQHRTGCHKCENSICFTVLKRRLTCTCIKYTEFS